MAIHEESFRIGSGRYLQGFGYIKRCAEEVLRLGNTPLVIGGVTALSKAERGIRLSFDAHISKYEIITYKSTCNDEKAKEIAEYAKTHGFDVIVGVGGGVIMDFAKLVAHFSALPVINIPTSSATCAAYTPLSVRYTEDGRTVGTLHYKKEVDCVIADTEIIATEPTRLFLSGVFDSLAKFVEIKHRFSWDMTEYPLGLDYAYAMSERSFESLRKLSSVCISKMSRGIVDADVENVIFSSIAVPGIISGVARGSNQTALGHKFYEGTRFLFPRESSKYLHGEIVGVGLLLQNHYNGELENNSELLSLMKENGMPYRVLDVGVMPSEENLEKYYDYIAGSSAISRSNADECKRLREGLEYLFNVK